MMWVPDGAKAGKISKPYGLRGELSILLEPETGSHIQPDHPLFIDIDGQRVPFFVEEVEILSGQQAIVKFEFIDTLEEARALSGCSLFFDPALGLQNIQSGGELESVIGYQAFDKKSGKLGTVTDYVPHSMNPVLTIDFEGKELMVPAVPEFIDRIDHGKRQLHLILPDGLISL